VGLNRELNYNFVHELKILKMHQAICGRTDLLDGLDEKKLKQRKKELKVAKRKQKEKYKNLKEVEEAGIQELNGLASSIKEIEDEIQAALARERQLKDQRAMEGESGWQIPIDDQRYGNLKNHARATREECQKVIVAQDRVIESLMEQLENERARHGPMFETRIDELNLKAVSLTSQIGLRSRSDEAGITPGGGKVDDKVDGRTTVEPVLKSPVEIWKELPGLELLDDGRIKLQVKDSFVIIAYEDNNIFVRSPEGKLLKELESSDEEFKLGTTFAKLVWDLRQRESSIV